ncbi:MAG: hypothetical protein A4E32_01182 [Methanomassiliicoccales archaeon PtaU1.Bin124]|nr:MAG: hypothetical protein A4E32_01182 [Methanomassiliicoccales archaeon PtaU1.Bin124]
MRKTILIAISIALMMGACPFLASGQASAATSVPTWSVGDSWALAGSKDVGVMYSSIDENWLKNSIYDSYADNATILSHSANGSMDMSVVFEVTAVSATTYTVTVTFGASLYLSFSQSVSGDMPVAGHYYTWTMSPSAEKVDIQNAPEAKKTITGSAKFAAATNGTIVLTVQKADMAIVSAKIGASSYAKGSITLTNFPMTEYGYTYGDSMVNVTYADVNAGINANMVLSAMSTLDTPLIAVPAGMNVGDDWYLSDAMITSGQITGSIDITGVPDAYKANVNQALAQYGITGFPINLADLTNGATSGFIYDHGQFSGSDQSISAHVTYARNKNVPDANGVNVNCIGLTSDTESYYLDPANMHLLASDATFELGSTEIILSLHAVPVATADTSITNVEHQVTDRSTYEDITGATSTGGGSIDSTTIILIVVVAAVAVFLVVAFLFLRRRK